MGTATRNLEDDHVHILRLIEVMGRVIGSENPEISHLEDMVDIIRNFADGIHHAKEENQFFPYLAKRGFSLQNGPVAVMLHEHVQGREYVKGMADGIGALKNGDLDALSDIYINMKGYGQLLHNHIGKENNILFRMADRALSEDDQLTLLKEFAEAEAGFSAVRKEKYINRINELAEEYGVE
jgi:hemerythrin-like domain-containing protein